MSSGNDDLVKRWDEYVESMGSVMGDVEHMTQQMRDHIKVLTAERDRLREALEGLMVHEPDYSDTLWQDAREALNGETP